MGGGAILLLKQLDAVVSEAEEANLATQMEEARLLNVSIKTSIAESRYAQGYNSV